MAAELKEFKTLASKVFLDPELLLGPFDSFPEFQELFPQGVRNHQDVRLLYKSFQKQRKLLQQQVKRNINQQYEIDLKQDAAHSASLTQLSGDLQLGDAVRILEEFSQALEEDGEMIKEKLSASERNIESLCNKIQEKFSDNFEGAIQDEYVNVLQDASNMLM